MASASGAGSLVRNVSLSILMHEKATTTGMSPVRRGQVWGVALSASVSALPWVAVLIFGGSPSLFYFSLLCNQPWIIVCKLLGIVSLGGPYLYLYGPIVNLVCGFAAGTLVGWLIKGWRRLGTHHSVTGARH